MGVAGCEASVAQAVRYGGMLGVLLTVLVAIGAIGIGKAKVGRWTGGIDPAARLAAHGLVGLASLGILTLLIGLIPGGFNWGLGVVALYTIVGAAFFVLDLRQHPVRASFPKGLDGLFLVAFVLGGLVSLAGVLSPSDTIDWDSLSYHLAVPKLYLQAGNIFPVFIHQSNFPSIVDYLYVWGLKWGGQSGAKAFSFCFYVWGLIAAFGIARGKYGEKAGFWAALTLAFVPVVMWESGTAYIDVSNGVFAGLGIAFASLLLIDKEQRQYLWLSAIFLGFAAGSKYTGLQTIFAVGIVVVAMTRSVSGFKSAVLIAAVASAVAAPWYIKNIVYTGNPVFPFFYEKLGGKNWDQRRAEIYRNQQLVFGIPQPQVAPTAPLLMRGGSSVLGLAYKPAEYIDAGQPRIGAIGAAILLSFLLWMVSGRAGVFEKGVLGTTLVSLAMWFVLSEQSRYIVPLMLPLAVLLGGGVRRLTWGPVLATVAGLQAAYSLWVLETDRVTQQMLVLTGKVTPEEYQQQTIPFYEASQVINQEVVGGKVALYDETFGFLLDVPYMWANPGHSTLIPYDSMKNGAEYADAMKKLGFTHVYVNARQMLGTKDAIDAWYASTGLNGRPIPWPDKDSTMANWEIKYKALVADAIAGGQLVPVQQFRGGSMLLKFQ
jgi:hypothetical protein